jgi:hypothetical protein
MVVFLGKYGGSSRIKKDKGKDKGKYYWEGPDKKEKDNGGNFGGVPQEKKST